MQTVKTSPKRNTRAVRQQKQALKWLLCRGRTYAIRDGIVTEVRHGS